MGGKKSKHSTISSLRNPYRDFANRAAHNINTQNSNGLGHATIAAAVPNPEGKDPLILVLRQNEDGKYAYDQELYDRCEDLLKNDGAALWDKREDGKRGSGDIDVRMEAEKNRRRREEPSEESRDRGGGEVRDRRGEERVPVGLREMVGGQRVYAPAAGREGQERARDRSEDEGAGKRDPGRRPGGGGGETRKREKRGKYDGSRSKEIVRGRSWRGIVDVDKGRHAFVRRKK